MMVVKTPPKWTNIYPQGTREGDEEQRFFIALARNQKWEWRSIKAIAKDSGLSQKRCEEIVQKYYKTGMILQSAKNEDLWAYWERVPKMATQDECSVACQDQKQRIKRAKP